jgi:CysZ protein
MPVPEAPSGRPGVLRRAAAGAWHVPAGFVFLLRNPPLWLWAVLPALLAAVLLVAGFLAGAFAAPRVQALVAPDRGRLPDWLDFLVTLVLWGGTMLTGMAVGFALALLLTAPILERLSRAAEVRARGGAADQASGLRWEVAQSLRGALYFLAAAPGVLLLSLVPLIGPPLAALWGGHALSFQLTDPPLTRRGLDFAAKRRWHRSWRAESVGFGIAGLVTLLVPFANLLVGPALAVGGTLLVLDLEEAVAAPEPTGLELASDQETTEAQPEAP